MTRRLHELAGPAAAAAITPASVVVIPTGAIEHHGPHLPLATDLITADAVASAAVERAVEAGVDAWLLPGLAYTKSDEHAWAPGTMWVTAETLLSTLVDLGRSLETLGATTVLFLNGHGGNVAPLGIALRELRRRFGLRTFATSVTVPCGDGESGGDEHGMPIHAGHGETSLLLHLRPELVDMSLAERHVPAHLGATPRIGFHSTPVSFGWLSDDFGPSGVIGDPTAASAAVGAEAFESNVAGAVESLLQITRFTHRPAEG
ncbi:creatininase family protein [Demequina mangrovi]|uniref:Creatinine amidohydrolase n=1 Tax=Demequina mangrovi TaxID=1043493 RepID=A0A1H7A2F0_9MICO|nr:creatininase family protein [Demequina mangrovi]SEJ59658.1 creatinine amidohydrolase [Demequina mangrovi]